MNQTDDFRTPGQLINALLTSKGWTQRVLAVVLGMDETGINKIVADKRPVSAELAILLEDVFGVSADKFVALQRDFDLAKARIVARSDPKRATRAQLYAGLPVAEMIKRGWLNASDVRDPSVETELAKFFGVETVEQIEILPHAAKKTAVAAETTPVQLAWLYRVRQIACEMIVAPYTSSALRFALKQLQPLTVSAEGVRKVPKILAECGIRFVIVESLPSAKIDGVCFWLDEKSPVIGMTLRFDRIDNFWFVLRHELEHVVHEHGKNQIVIDSELEGERANENGDIAVEERIANAAASEFCVPKNALDAFIARKAPLFAARDVLGFAATIRVHPGLVAGQLQHKTGRFEILREHLVKVRAFIAPNAVVDGWGDIAPVGA
jgi:HTH-type transcriptional regulator/antitoxin HigA